MDADYSALTARELLTKDLEELKITLTARKEAAAEAAAQARAEARTRDGGGGGSGRGGANSGEERQAPAAAAAAQVRPHSSNADSGDRSMRHVFTLSMPVLDASMVVGAQAAAAAAGPQAAPPAAPSGDGPLDIPAAQVTTLQGHTNEVFICAWSPTAPLLASG